MATAFDIQTTGFNFSPVLPKAGPQAILPLADLPGLDMTRGGSFSATPLSGFQSIDTHPEAIAIGAMGGLDAIGKGINAAYKTQQELQKEKDKEENELEKERLRLAEKNKENIANNQRALDVANIHAAALKAKLAKDVPLSLGLSEDDSESSTTEDDSESSTTEDDASAPSTGKATQYGPYEGKPGSRLNNDGTIGAYDNILGQGDAGLSPDFEKTFVSKGGKLGDRFTVKYADGTTREGVFADRTSPELAGRVDWWSKEGNHEDDGKPVVSIDPTNAVAQGKPAWDLKSPVPATQEQQLSPSDIPAITAAIPAKNLSASLGAGAPPAELRKPWNITTPVPKAIEQTTQVPQIATAPKQAVETPTAAGEISPRAKKLIENFLTQGGGIVTRKDAGIINKYAKDNDIMLEVAPSGQGIKISLPKPEVLEQIKMRKEKAKEESGLRDVRKNNLIQNSARASVSKDQTKSTYAAFAGAGAGRPSIQSAAEDALDIYSKYKEGKLKTNTATDEALLDSYVKLVSGGVVREGQVKLFKQGEPVAEQVKAYLQKYGSGGVLTPKIREDVLNVVSSSADDKRKIANNSINQDRSQILSQLESSPDFSGMSRDQIEEYADRKHLLPKPFLPYLTQDTIQEHVNEAIERISSLQQAIKDAKDQGQPTYDLEEQLLNVAKEAKYIGGVYKEWKSGKLKGYDLNKSYRKNTFQGIPNYEGAYSSAISAGARADQNKNTPPQ